MAALSRDCTPEIGTKSYPIQYEQQRSGDPFHVSQDKFSGPKSCFMFAVFTFKIKVSKILKMIRWKYQLTKQNWTVCELGTVLLFNRFWLQNLPSDPEKKTPDRRLVSHSTSSLYVVFGLSALWLQQRRLVIRAPAEIYEQWEWIQSLASADTRGEGTRDEPNGPWQTYKVWPQWHETQQSQG